ncbi:tRNA (adenine(22)-N(1))-methyltransferase TrmK [Sporosarcina sp. YIM B06819]|uniref:tRNA (adenine(22)-N(1))-methyltransferase n=1 Tax=Sporosarcina sp. YIM B06819 TaxID=3081769 RepID=UPI00298C1534|nr:tRNA (adenine(22)-N(1))-methyltransferase TrmK [Sporosarcina sp. YIM B06819]
MNTERLSTRLATVASFVETGAVVADIGSDHAYLPCFLVHNGTVQKAVAGEVVKGPYESAVRNVRREGLSSAVTVRLANGLFAIEEGDAVDTVTIAGMGGPLIATILESGKNRLRGVKRIIAQPNIYAKAIREWAVANDWIIYNEAILKEDGKIYEIIVLERGTATYDELQLLVGPFLLQSKSAVFLEKWERELSEWQRVLSSLQQAEQTEAIQARKQELLTHIDFVGKVLAT